MINEFESALARIAAAEERAAQAVEEARRSQEEARRIHMEITKAYIGALTAMEPVGSNVVTSEPADARGDEELESGSEADEEEENEVADGEGEVGNGGHEQGSAAVS